LPFWQCENTRKNISFLIYSQDPFGHSKLNVE
jgi:hypothetical protein